MTNIPKTDKITGEKDKERANTLGNCGKMLTFVDCC